MNDESRQPDDSTMDGESDTSWESSDARAEGSIETTTDSADSYRQDDFAYVGEDGTEHTPLYVDFTARIWLLLIIYLVSWLWPLADVLRRSGTREGQLEYKWPSPRGYSHIGLGINFVFFVWALRYQRKGFVVGGIEQLQFLTAICYGLYFTLFCLEIVGIIPSGNIYQNDWDLMF